MCARDRPTVFAPLFFSFLRWCVVVIIVRAVVVVFAVVIVFVVIARITLIFLLIWIGLD